MKTFRLLLLFGLIFGLKLCSFGSPKGGGCQLFYLNLPSDFLALLQQKFAILNEEAPNRRFLSCSIISSPYETFKTFFDQKYPFIQTGMQEHADMQLCCVTEHEKDQKKFFTTHHRYPKNDIKFFLEGIDRLINRYSPHSHFDDVEDAAMAYYLFVLCMEKFPFNAWFACQIRSCLVMLIPTLKENGELPTPADELKMVLNESVNPKVADVGIFEVVKGSKECGYGICQWFQSTFGGWF